MSDSANSDKTEERISTPSKTQTRKIRSLVIDTIHKIINLVPHNASYEVVHNQLHNLEKGLAYTAPEIYDRKWYELYEILQRNIPAPGETEIKLEWEKTLQGVWRDSNQRYIEILREQKDSVDVNENNTTP